MVSLVQDKVTIRLRLWPGNELETARRELVVSGSGLMAARTNCGRTLARTHRDFNPFVIGAEARLLVNESRKTMTTIWNRDELEHEVETGEGENYQNKPRARTTP
jgi:hypothetical protein